MTRAGQPAAQRTLRYKRAKTIRRGDPLEWFGYVTMDDAHGLTGTASHHQASSCERGGSTRRRHTPKPRKWVNSQAKLLRVRVSHP